MAGQTKGARSEREPLSRLPDGTIKQVNPFTGTQVWTVPGRANRPFGSGHGTRHRLDTAQRGRYCAFCEDRYLETPPEKGRIVRSGTEWRRVTDVTAETLSDTVAEFRLIPNLFEILSFDYWRLNYGYAPTTAARERERAYLSTPAGRAHVLDIARAKAAASGVASADWDDLPPEEQLRHAEAFFGGCHDVVVARRHYLDRAKHDDQVASSGSLSPEEHEQYLAFTVDAVGAQYAANPYARYVQALQNWLRPAGASFDHLHKQVVAIDELSVETQRQLERVREDPWVYAHLGVGYAAERGLVIAENRHAVAVAGVGHRYPSVVVYSKSATREPWRHTAEELRGFSDLVHAMHAATGPQVPVNEQWYHEPPGIGVAMPFRVVVSLRISTLAGFEGGTKIYINTIDPWTLAQRFVASLLKLRALGAVADFDIGPECTAQWASLKYARVAAASVAAGVSDTGATD